MRELKFRVWHKILKNYAHIKRIWLDGDGNGHDEIFAVSDAETTYPIYEIELEQYTGLKDKNGKEIYEGDILKFRGRAYEVKFDNYGQFYIENKKYHWLENGYSFRSVDIWCAEGILVEVVGNIHENPELIGGKE